MSSDANFRIRALSRDEMSLPIEWAALEGWNPGLHDAACFYAADPGGFLVGELDGEPVGCISAVKYGSEFGFIGLYIVRPEFRGRGFGIQLWRAAMEGDGGLTYAKGPAELRPGDIVSVPSGEPAGLSLRERTTRLLREVQKRGLTVGRLEDYV